MTIKSIFESIINTEIKEGHLFIICILLGAELLMRDKVISKRLESKEWKETKLSRAVFFIVFFIGFMWLNVFGFSIYEWALFTFFAALLVAYLTEKVVNRKKGK